jgi:hypothetical protein
MRLLLHFYIFSSLLVAATGVPAQAQYLSSCGLKLEVTAIGTHLIGTLRTSSGAICSAGNIKWYDDKTEQLLQEGPLLDYTLANYGDYTIKALFQTELPGSQFSCSGELKQYLQVVEPTCMQMFLNENSALFPNINAQVCGCNGTTYQNEFEARAGGASSWWAGDCSSQPSTSTCGSTELGVNVYGGNPTDGYWVQFSNLAVGNFTHIQLDFGDNCQLFQSPQWTTKNHHYAKGGIYKVTLTAWNINQPGCVSSYTKIFSTDALSLTNASVPASFDYVMPGDANGDGKADAYDILQVSQGYGKNGSPRPEASNDWAFQYAPNWSQITTKGINYKHIDANGDGFINEFDTEPLELHYQPVGPLFPQTFKSGVPQFYTRFVEDTLYLDPAHPDQLEINAEIMIGSADQPVMDLYGVACALKYPEFVAHDPTMFYDPSFFGSSNYILSLGRDNHDIQQFDLGFARKNGAGTTGYGRIAKLTFRADFIIIIDIIDRAESDVLAFTIPVEGIRAVDSAGNVIALSPTDTPDTLWIKNIGSVSKVNELLLENEVRIFPNPTTDKVNLQTGDLHVQSITIVNTLGQAVQQMTPTFGQKPTQIDVRNWSSGMYTARITSDKGVVEKQFIVQ